MLYNLLNREINKINNIDRDLCEKYKQNLLIFFNKYQNLKQWCNSEILYDSVLSQSNRL